MNDLLSRRKAFKSFTRKTPRLQGLLVKYFKGLLDVRIDFGIR